jgi:hypothetical protein
MIACVRRLKVRQLQGSERAVLAEQALAAAHDD